MGREGVRSPDRRDRGLNKRPVEGGGVDRPHRCRIGEFAGFGLVWLGVVRVC